MTIRPEATPDSAVATMLPLDDAPVHLVLKQDWPIALCGAEVRENFGTKAPGRDRCPSCLRIADRLRLGRVGWQP